ncbi:hypothetical protein [Nonomuraea sp. SYSU D8015]|uniref:hypothetical protein n=1 Tax=Nonomuraea sp. SYSU D8015 TaxID=2593644 RepID=UPI0016615DA0|nr:hypothetical protein [Nonomuraea sp. SYSU D8015]
MPPVLGPEDGFSHSPQWPTKEATPWTTMRAAQQGLDAAGEDSIAGRRLHEMKGFYAYMTEQLIPLIDNWRERYAARHADTPR